MRISSIITASTMLLMAASATARTTEDIERELLIPEKTEFRPHWTIQLQAGAGYTIGENDRFTDLLSPAAAVNIGYSFNPLFSLRAGGSGWQARGAWAAPYSRYKYNYLQANVDAMLSLTDLFRGFKPNRRFNLYGFLGIGGNYAFHNDEAERLAASGMNFQKLWHGHRWGIAARGGAGINLWLNRSVAINVEANANMLPDNFNSKRGSHYDWQYNLLAGVSIRLGGGNTRTIPAVYKQVASTPQSIPQPQPETVESAPVATVQELEQVKPLEQHIFFSLNSAKIKDSETDRLTSLIQYMKEHPEAHVVITGYADRATGTPRYNMTLSQRRAKAVADILINDGIKDTRITIAAKGDTTQPFEINELNRVVIAIAGDSRQ